MKALCWIVWLSLAACGGQLVDFPPGDAPDGGGWGSGCLALAGAASGGQLVDLPADAGDARCPSGDQPQ
jgi:hypothetical protein